ncbi:hypothetical protein TrLO_g8004 [Triparma laevis f. longispina]|uniref:Uncharacterized protein n=1 Tax=Triparma laevis f. longispina TaxID=1714387 RepID=A0A9W6ZYN4_9STRA|nr:hypothetical protein TrLO_g8004 [Triparma laevis f. longispina]
MPTSESNSTTTMSTSNGKVALKRYLPPLTKEGFETWSLRPRMSTTPLPSTPLYTLKPPLTSTSFIPLISVFTVPMYLSRMIGLSINFKICLDLTMFNSNGRNASTFFNVENEENVVVNDFNDEEDWGDYDVEKVKLKPNGEEAYPTSAQLLPHLSKPGNICIYDFDSSLTLYVQIFYLCKILRWPFDVAYEHVGGLWDGKAAEKLISEFNYTGDKEIKTIPPPSWIPNGPSTFPIKTIPPYKNDGFAMPLSKKRPHTSISTTLTPKIPQTPWVKLEPTTKIHARVTSVIKSLLLKPDPETNTLTPQQVLSLCKSPNSAITWLPETPSSKILFLRDGVFSLSSSEIYHIPKVTLNNSGGQKTHRTVLKGYIVQSLERGRCFLGTEVGVEEGRGVKGREYERREKLKAIVKNRVEREGEGVIVRVKNVFKPEKLEWMIKEFKGEGGVKGVEVRDMVEGGGGVCEDLEGLIQLIDESKKT